jgi:hypothetical protein
MLVVELLIVEVFIVTNRIFDSVNVNSLINIILIAACLVLTTLIILARTCGRS